MTRLTHALRILSAIVFGAIFGAVDEVALVRRER